jgi:hypothetical protein
MKSQFTPGPWRAIPTTAISRNPHSLRMDIVSTSGEWNPAFIAGDILPDDARLIASAPELLVALERIESALEHEPEIYADILSITRAAIAKAKGQQ